MAVAQRRWLTAIWVANSVVSGVYAALCLYVFNKTNKIFRAVESDYRYVFMGLLAATILSFIVVAAFFAMSNMLLLRRSMAHTKMAGFGYGVLVASSLHTSIFLLLCGLVLNASDKTVRGFEGSASWSGGTTALYLVTFVLAYVCALSYFLMFLALLLCREAFVPQPASPVPAAAQPAPADKKSPRKGGKAGKHDSEPVDVEAVAI